MKSVRRVVLLSFCALSPPCSAIADNTARVYINPNASGGTGPYEQTVTQPGTVDAAGSATGGFNSSGNASAHTEYGRARLTGQAAGTLASTAIGIFRDTITITSPGIPAGTFGTLTYRVTVAGDVAATNGASVSTWTLQADIGGGATDIFRSGRHHSPELPNPGYSGDPFGTYSATISFQYGFAAQLYVELSATAGAGYGASGAGAATFPTPITSEWGGITDVTANGSPVSTFTVTSHSGTNWATPPAPPCDGDVNCDGNLDGFDVETMERATGGDLTDFCQPDPDFNHDGNLDGFDVEAVELVTGGGPCP